MRTVGGTVPFPVPAEVAFDYLVDPVNRPQWQSSLAAVEDVTGQVGVGQTWTDVTKPGLRPAMRTTSYDRPPWTWSSSRPGPGATCGSASGSPGPGRCVGSGCWRRTPRCCRCAPT